MSEAPGAKSGSVLLGLGLTLVLRIIPFDTCNLFYRDDLERTRLAPLVAGGMR